MPVVLNSQTSQFGAFLDIVLDVATRGVIWTLSLPHGLGSIFIVLEMSVLVVTHQVRIYEQVYAAKFTLAVLCRAAYFSVSVMSGPTQSHACGFLLFSQSCSRCSNQSRAAIKGCQVVPYRIQQIM
jgi:phosphatidylglycerophosphate synthase